MGLTDDRDISETVGETWSTNVLGSDFDPNVNEDRLQEITGNWYSGPAGMNSNLVVRSVCPSQKG